MKIAILGTSGSGKSLPSSTFVILIMERIVPMNGQAILLRLPMLVLRNLRQRFSRLR